LTGPAKVQTDFRRIELEKGRWLSQMSFLMATADETN
jgi:hypothetical protein